jgi:predicted MFS family arabinose efflux permease
VALGTIGGSLIGGVLADGIGRKRTILLVSILFALGWVLIARAKTVRDILIGRLLTGVASGGYSSAVQVSLSLLPHPK